MESGQETLKQLFQQEFSKMVAVLSRKFGLQNIETAEDIVSETFLQAAEIWGVKGLPQNPTAWLYTVAKQKTLYQFRRNKIFDKKVIPGLASSQEKYYEIEELDFSRQNINDSMMQMLFAVCTPLIGSEAQIGLALRILCGFGIDEIAEAFLSNKETINKRLFRAKEKLRTENVTLDLPPEDELAGRLNNVLHIIYLLFSEGYYSKTQNQILRRDLCLEAIRLAIMLTGYESTNRPETNALIALMCFHASRFNARQTNEEPLVLFEKQNEELWDKELIYRGWHYLNLSAQGNELSSYHLEARIASLHCSKEDTKEKWEEILQLYNQLLHVNYTPGVALNRIYALYKAKACLPDQRGVREAIEEAEKLKLESSHFYFILLGELYKSFDTGKAKLNFQKAYTLAKTQTEKQCIQQKIDNL
jgi:RNA polymerase sigma-70 factor (ECF subfamily)